MNKFIIILFFHVVVFDGALATVLPTFSLTTNNGLASNNVHDIHLDNEGRLWVATDLGLSVYNGFDVFTYTVNDGLPDNVIFEIFQDEKKRIWVVSKSCKLAYIENGLLTRYKYNHIIEEFRERVHYYHNDFFVDSLDNIRLSINTIGHIQIDSTGNTKTIQKPKMSNKKKSQFIEEIDEKNLIFYTERVITPNVRLSVDTYFLWEGKKAKMVTHERDLTLSFFNYLKVGDSVLVTIGKHLYTVYDSEIISVRSFDNSILSIAQHNHHLFLGFHSSGVKIFDIDNYINGETVKEFFDNRTCTKVVVNPEGGYWFSVLGRGVLFVSNIHDQGMTIPEHPISLDMSSSGLFVGTEEGFLYQLNSSKKLSTTSKLNLSIGPIHQVLLKKNYVFIRSGRSFYYLKDKIPIKIPCQFPECNVKKLILDNKGEIYGLGNSIYKIENFEFVKIIESEHLTYFTCMISSRDKPLLIGANDGLYYYQDSSLKYLGEKYSIFTSRISDLCVIDSTSAIMGTEGNGLYVINTTDFSIKKINNANSELNNISAIVKRSPDTFLVQSGTYFFEIYNNSKTNEYQLQWTTPFNARADYSYKQIFDSNIVINLNGRSIEAVNYCSSLNTKTNPVVKLKDIYINGERQSTRNLQLSYNENNVKIDFEGICLLNSESLVYKYKLNNKDTSWVETNENSIHLLELAPKNYSLQIKAFIQNGNLESAILPINIDIRKPFWRTLWFNFIILLLAISLSAIVIIYNIWKVNKKADEKVKLHDLLSELELKALRAQMNSHFLFNALNGIRSLIIQEKTSLANEYLVDFSKLLRSIIDNSFKGYITLEEELASLRRYINLENLRFGNNIEYLKDIDPELNLSSTKIPSLLLQPFVENSIVHGFINNSGGRINLSISRENKLLKITIKDNGIGRGKSHENKSNDHKSVAVYNSEKRLELTNKKLGGDIVNLEYNDYTDKNNVGIGTEVVLLINDASIKH